MIDTEPQTAAGKVLWHFTMTLDGFVAGPEHAMDWMTGFTARDGLNDEYVRTTGAVLAGRSGFDSAIGDSRPYGDEWVGPIFILTHHPEDAPPTPGITFLSCEPAEAVRIGLAGAAGKNLEIFSPDIGRQLLALGLIDEIDLHVAPVLLGDGIRLFDNPGGTPVRLEMINADDPDSRRQPAIPSRRGSGRSVMLTRIAEDVLVHQSELLQNNTVVVQGRAGVLIIDPGIQASELACLVNDLRELGQPVVAGFATHPDWDHVLWHADLGAAPRYGTARCADQLAELRSKPDWQDRRHRGAAAGDRRGDTAGPVRS